MPKTAPRPAARRRPGPRPAAPARPANTAKTAKTAKTTRPAAAPPPDLATRDAVFLAAAEAFSAHGFDGVSVDAIAARARVNKAMIYYHFDDKLALYREVVRDMLRAIGARITGIAGTADPADEKVKAFIAALVDLTGTHPWFPTLMIREIAEGAPRLDADTLGLIRHVFVTFGGLLAEGQAAGLFRPVNPVLAYMSALGPLMFNAAR
ncbi:MAG: TetR/AcrR family transcriptional regulator [Vicinamibacteria bacterium]